MDSQIEQWRIGKTVDIGHLVTTGALVIAAFWFIADMNTRIAVMEAQVADRDRMITEIRTDIKDIKQMLYEMKD